MADIVKIENYEGTADTFTLPYNPKSYQEQNQTYNEGTEVKYSNFHIFIGNNALRPKKLSFSGNFSQSGKDADYEDLARRIREGSKLKKIFFRDDRFHIAVGSNFQKSHTNERTNFIDYVFACSTPIPLAFGSNQKTATYDGNSFTSGGTNSNDGGEFTYIEKVEFTLSAGVSSGDTITFVSNNTSGIQVTFTSSYSSGETFTLNMIQQEETAGLFQTKYWQCEDSSGNKQGRSKSSGKNELALRLDRTEQIDSYTVGGTASISNATFYFRDGYNGG